MICGTTSKQVLVRLFEHTLVGSSILYSIVTRHSSVVNAVRVCLCGSVFLPLTIFGPVVWTMKLFDFLQLMLTFRTFSPSLVTMASSSRPLPCLPSPLRLFARPPLPKSPTTLPPRPTLTVLTPTGPRLRATRPLSGTRTLAVTATDPRPPPRTPRELVVAGIRIDDPRPDAMTLPRS